MDLTDINPTIISTDTEDEDHVDGACHKPKRKPSKLSFKNPVVRWFICMVNPLALSSRCGRRRGRVVQGAGFEIWSRGPRFKSSILPLAGFVLGI